MKRDCFHQTATEFIPSFTLGENAVAQRARVEATLLRVANLEDQLHRPSIPKPDRQWLAVAAAISEQQAFIQPVMMPVCR